MITFIVFMINIELFIFNAMQFSPTSEHLLLAYGRRHNTLLKSVVVDGETAVPIYTILEVKLVAARR